MPYKDKVMRGMIPETDPILGSLKTASKMAVYDHLRHGTNAVDTFVIFFIGVYVCVSMCSMYM